MQRNKEIELRHFQKSAIKDMKIIEEDIKWTIERWDKAKENYATQIQELEFELTRARTLEHMAETKYDNLEKLVKKELEFFKQQEKLEKPQVNKGKIMN